MAAPAAHRGTGATRAENGHVAIGVAGAVVGLVVGLIALRGTAALSGTGSIGQVAALSVAGCGTATSVLVLVADRVRTMPWFGSRPLWRRALDVVGLSLIHGLLGLFLTGALFAVFQQAFQGVALDRFAGTFWVAAASGGAAYIASSSVMALTGRSLATLLAAFVTVGVLASALSAPDPYWWERYFSELGEGTGASSTIFNLTLLLTGIALLTVVEFIAHDLDRWARATGEDHRAVTAVRVMLTLVGVLVALVALVSRSVSVLWHDVVAQSLVVVFALTLLVLPVLLRRLPGALISFTAGAFALLMMVVVLYTGVGYLNFTAFEMGAAVIVFVWLLLLIRTVSAAAEGLPEDGTGAGAAGPPQEDPAVTAGPEDEEPGVSS